MKKIVAAEGKRVAGMAAKAMEFVAPTPEQKVKRAAKKEGEKKLKPAEKEREKEFKANRQILRLGGSNI